MDEQPNRNDIHWEINVGDLVKAKYYHIDTHGGEVGFNIGIVIGEKHIGQLTMFPEVKVYLFKEKKTRSFTAGSLEIVSNRG
jgi:hypothetical protein